jgi:hypothetical protein
MKAFLAAFLLVAIAGTAAAFQPRTGHWWNPDESGSGYNIDIQDGVLVITFYSYQVDGAAQWYLSSGAMTNDQQNFTGTLDKYVGGECISCPYAGRPTLVGNDGTVSIAFASETSATLTLPGGRITQIQPFNFATGDPPTGLLGEWVFIYDVGTTTVANRYDLSTVLPPSSANGSGVATDLGRLAGCELQISGAAAGIVVCAVVNATGTVQFGYSFRFGLDQTYGGLWLSADGMTSYAMKGFKVISKSGFTNDASVATSTVSTADATRAQQAAVNISAAPDQVAKATVGAAMDAIHRALTAQPVWH